MTQLLFSTRCVPLVPSARRRRLLAAAGAALIGLAMSSAAASAPVPSAEPIPAPAAALKPNWRKSVVLVHGAFADGSCWNEVIRLLQARGVEVTAVQNPLQSLAGDVHALNKVLNQQTQAVVLVGHSWGGMVVTEGGQHPKVASLVYVAAFAPGQGLSVAALLSQSPTPAWLADLRTDEDGYSVIGRKAYQQYFAQDLPGPQALMLAAAQVPTFGGTLLEPATQTAWTSRPSWYVLAEQDRFIPPELQSQMARSIGARVTRVPASHVVMISQPQRVVDVIIEALHQ